MLRIMSIDLTERAISEICALDWAGLAQDDMMRVAWGYYFFSIQFRENLQLALRLYPDDKNLQSLAREECQTDNLSPFPGIACFGEALDHDEFMRRALGLSPIEQHSRDACEAAGRNYLAVVREMAPTARALSISSYEDGGLERLFRAILRSPDYDNLTLQAFRFFLEEHIKFDSDPDMGHGQLSRHLAPDDSVAPLWEAFARLLFEVVPALGVTGAEQS